MYYRGFQPSGLEQEYQLRRPLQGPGDAGFSPLKKQANNLWLLEIWY